MCLRKDDGNHIEKAIAKHPKREDLQKKDDIIEVVCFIINMNNTVMDKNYKFPRLSILLTNMYRIKLNILQAISF